MDPRIEEFCSVLGLMSPKDFENSGARRGGKTTKLLLEALVAISDGKKVSIAAKPADYASELTSRLRGWARDLGLDLELVLEPLVDRQDTRVKTSDIQWFLDNSWEVWQRVRGCG